MKYIVSACFLLLFSQIQAQQNYIYNPAIDVQHYRFSLTVNDDNDTLKGTAVITVKYRKAAKDVVFDLVDVGQVGKGMTVDKVEEGASKLKFSHKAEKLTIQLNRPAVQGEQHVYSIQYKGVPADGLIFSKNKYGDRTIFADNWPNRAHNWIPCSDNPSDKASVEFEVTTPEHYQVVANGLLVEESNLPIIADFITGKKMLLCPPR